MKCATNPSPNSAYPISGLNVNAIASSAIPNNQTKVSPANACAHRGRLSPAGTRGLSDGQKPRDRSTICSIGFALSSKQRFLFAKNQAINEKPIRQDEKNEAHPARERSNSRPHRQIREIKWIARVANRSVGH